ncbi:hypothetical protein HLK59_34600 [Streptomyces sp. S3(2020)]|uniref:hypothetical protein n=1 Tax=Streptomyces sp. S3(2020) TaxID=2732044 RepID=UPI001488D42F|nr:hypothetical protein [Streptomyces sp. S3(2020)]NNN35413.1 hypothetical protein [Streptomyces sp. S3(2020)]
MSRDRSRVRDAWGIAGFLVFLVVGLAVLVLVFGGARWLGREAVPELVGLPGGAWTGGIGLGVVSVLGWIGAGAAYGIGAAGKADEARWLRGARAVAGAVGWVAAIGPVVVLFSGLPGRNCRSSACEYVPGTGTAFLAYALAAGSLGWLCHRWRRAVVEAGEAERRERMRKLRKKGKGKSRVAR